MAVYEGMIEKLTPEGDGALTDVKGCLVSIPGTLPGEKVRYRVEHVSPHEKRVWASCCAVLQKCPERREAPCRESWPTRGACGGCPLMHMNDALQAAFKKNLVLDVLKKNGLNYISDIEYVRSPNVLGYRNRTDLVAGVFRGRAMLGSYEPRTHRVVPTRRCPILRSPLSQALNACVNVMNEQHIPVFELGRNMRSTLRYVSFFANDAGDVLIDFVVMSDAGKRPEWVKRFAFALKDAFVRLQGVSFSINDSANNAIRIAPSTVLWGDSRLSEHYGELETRLCASGFTQLNSEVAAMVYASGRDWLGHKSHVVWDLYCGAGSFGRTLAPTHRLFGAEFSERAIETAEQLAQNDPWASVYEVMDLEKVWPDHWTRPDVILVDPPRKGLSELVIQKLCEMHGTDLIYMSCNPESFAKNAAKLDPFYVIERIAAFDMMPQTRHVELLALMRPRS